MNTWHNPLRLLILLMGLTMVSGGLCAAISNDERSAAARDSQGTLEVWLDRSDSATSDTSWLSTANQGRQAALAIWERAVAHWDLSAEDQAAERSSLEGVLDEAFRERYQQWVIKRFFQEKEQTPHQDFWTALRNNELNYLFVQANGQIQRDSQGDPLLKDSTDFEADKQAWMADANAARDARLADWEQTLRNALPELLGGVQAVDQERWRGTAEAIIAKRRTAYSRDLAAMYEQALQRFSAVRLYDQYSLARKAEQSGAAALTTGLIDGVNDVLNRDLNLLAASLGLVREGVDAQTEVDSEAWQASFQNLLETGLDKWAAAEKRLLAERLAWEKQANATYQESESAWAKALGDLKQAQTSWERKLQRVLQDGEAAWATKKKELADSIAQASSELEREIATRNSTKATQISSLVNLYGERTQLLKTASESGLFWFEKYGAAARGANASEFTWANLNQVLKSRAQSCLASFQDSWMEAQARNASLKQYLAEHGATVGPVTDPSQVARPPYEWTYGAEILRGNDIAELQTVQTEAELAEADCAQRLQTLTDSLSRIGSTELAGPDRAALELLVGTEVDFASYSEAAWWLKQKDSASQDASLLRQKLTDTLDQIVSDGQTLQSLKSIVNPERNSDDGYLDEYQVELLKAKALESYWDCQVKIETAVYEYASTDSSLRPTDSELLAEWRRVKLAYTSSKASYSQAVAALEAAGTSLSGKKTAIDAARAELEVALAEIQRQEEEYATKKALFSTNQSEFYQQQITSYHQELLKHYGLQADPDVTSQADLLVNYRAAMNQYGFDQELNGYSQTLQVLVQGDVRPDAAADSSLSLAQLRQAVATPAAMPANLDNAHAIPATSSLFAAANSLRDAYLADKAAGANATDLGSYLIKMKALYQSRRLENARRLVERETAIKLILAAPGEAIFSSLTANSLKSEQIAAEAALAKARLEGMADVLILMADPANALASNQAVVGVAALLKQAQPKIGAAAASYKAGVLALVAAGTTGGWWTDLSKAKAGMGTFLETQTDAGLRDFLVMLMNGSSGLSVASGVDALVLLTATAQANLDEVNAKSRAREGWQLASYALVEGDRTSTRQAIRQIFADAGMIASTAAANLLVPGAAAVDTVLASWAANKTIEAKVSQLSLNLRGKAAVLSISEQDALSRFLASLSEQSAWRAWEGGNTTVALADLDTRTSEIQASIQALQERLMRLGSALYPAPADTAAAVSQKRLAALAEAWSLDAATHETALKEDLTLSLVRKALLAYGTPADQQDIAKLQTLFASIASVQAVDLTALKSSVVATTTTLLQRIAYLAKPMELIAPDAAAHQQAVFNTLSRYAQIPVGSYLNVANLGEALSVWNWFNQSREEGGLAGSFDPELEDDQKALEDFLAALPDGGVTTAATAQQFLAGMTAGTQSHQEIWASIIAPSLKPFLANISALGPGAAAFERAIALYLAGLVGNGSDHLDRYAFLQQMTGFQSYGSVDESFFGMVTDASVYAAAFEGFSGHADQQAVRSWYAARQFAQGQETEALALIGGLDADHQAQMRSWFNQERLRRDYVAAIHGSVSDYIALLKSKSVAFDEAALRLAIASGIGSDPFTNSLVMSSTKESTGEFLGFDDCLRNDPTMTLQGLDQGIQESIKALYDELALIREKKAFRTSLASIKARMDRSEKGYRAYLNGNLVKLTGDGRAPVSKAVGTQALDSPIDASTSGLAHADGTVNAQLADFLLESFQALNRSASDLAATMRDPTTAEAAARSALFKTSFANGFQNLFGASAISAWDSAKAHQASATYQDDVQASRKKLDASQQTVTWLQTKIASLGAALVSLGASAEDKEKELVRLSQEIRIKRDAYNSSTTSFHALMAEYSTLCASYNDAYGQSENAWQTMEGSRDAFEMQDAIKTWAEDTYLHDELGTGTANDPAKQLQDAKAKLARVMAVYQALDAQVGDTATERQPFPLASQDSIDYVRIGQQIKSLQEIQENLATLIQAMIDATDDSHERVVDAGRQFIPSYGTNPFSGAGASSDWAKYVIYDTDGHTWRLNFDSSFKLSERTEAQTTAMTEYGKVKDYGELDPDTLMADEAGLMAWLSQKSLADPAAYKTMMESWALAADWVLQQLSVNNDGLKDLYEATGLSANLATKVCVNQPVTTITTSADGVTETVYTWWMEDGSSSEETTRVSSSGEQLYSFRRTISAAEANPASLQWEWQYRSKELSNALIAGDLPVDRRGTIDLKPIFEVMPVVMKTLQLDAWNRVRMDPAQAQMFQRMLALRVSGQLKNDQLFNDSSAAKAYELVVGGLHQSVTSNRSGQSSSEAVAIGFLKVLLNPLSWLDPFLVTVASIGLPVALLVEANYKSRADDCAAWLRSIQSVPSAKAASAASGLLGIEATLWANQFSLFQAQKAKLDTLKGAAAGSSLTKAEFKAAMVTGQFWSDGLSVIVDEWFDKVSATDKSDATSTLDAMLRMARITSSEKMQAIETILAAKNQTVNQALNTFTSLRDQYLQGTGGVSVAALRAAASAAFTQPSHTSLAEARFLTGIYQQLDGGPISSSSRVEAEKTALLSEEGDQLNKLQVVRMNHLLAVRQAEWQLLQQDFDRKYQAWKARISALYDAGASAWKEGLKKLSTAQESWETHYQETYAEKAAQWDASLQVFQADRFAWLQDLSVNAASTMDAVSLGKLNDAPSQAERLALLSQAGDLEGASSGISSLMAEIQENSAISQAERLATSLVSGIAEIGSPLHRGIRADLGAAQAMAEIAKIQLKDRSELSAHSAKILAIKARETVARAKADSRDQVAEANSSFESNMDDIFLGAGFQKFSGSYSRSSIIYSSLESNEYENQFVNGFTPFTIPDFATQTRLDDAALSSFDGTGIQAQVQKALTEVRTIMESIFGKKDEKGQKIVFKINGGKASETDSAMNDAENASDWTVTASDLTDSTLREAYNQDTFNLEEAWNSLWAGGDPTSHISGATEVRTMGAGSFNSYLGYTPIFKAGADVESSDIEAGYQKSVLNPGVGELGRLMGHFIYFQMRHSKGMSEVGIPFTKKRLWNDRGSWFKAPTLEAISDIQATIAGAINPYVGLIAGAADSIITGAIEIGYDNSKAGSVIFDKVKEMGLRVASFGVGSAFKGAADAAAGITDAAGKVFATAGVNLARQVTTNLVTGAIGSANLVNGRMEFNMGAYMNSMIGRDALAGYASSFAGDLVTGGINTTHLTGYNQGQQGLASQFAGFAGSAVGSGVTWAMTGQLNLNVLNVSDFTGGRVNSGLLELHLGGEGASMNFGSGGLNVSASNLIASMQGLGVFELNNRIENFSDKAGTDVATMLRAQYGFGDRWAQSQADGILSSKISLMLGGGAGNAETIVDAQGNRQVRLAAAPGASDEDQLRAAITLQHEAYRDGRNNGVAGQFAETINAVRGHTVMADKMLKDRTTQQMISNILANDENIRSDFVSYRNLQQNNGVGGFLTYVAGSYDSSADYWKLTSTGNLAYDGKANVYDENGVLIRETKSQGIEGSLLEILGLEDNANNRAAVVSMMKSSGLEQDTKGNWIGTDTSVKRRIPYGGASGAYLANHFNLTAANMGKEISLYSIDSLFASLGSGKATYQKFIEKNYMNALSFNTFVNGQKDSKWTQDIYSKAYSADERSRIQANMALLQTILSQGIDYSKVAPGATQTTAFGDDVNVSLTTSSVAGAVSFFEEHTGLDYGAGGTGIYTPGGFWEVIDKDNHKLYLQLYGTDAKMRIMHLDPTKVDDLSLGQIIGSANGNTKIIDYPTESFGSGSGAHTHIDFTRIFAGNASYFRSFVNPSNWSNGNQLEYQYIYFGANKSPLAGYPKYFYRY